MNGWWKWLFSFIFWRGKTHQPLNSSVFLRDGPEACPAARVVRQRTRLLWWLDLWPRIRSHRSQLASLLVIGRNEMVEEFIDFIDVGCLTMHWVILASTFGRYSNHIIDALLGDRLLFRSKGGKSKMLSHKSPRQSLMQKRAKNCSAGVSDEN